MKLDAESGKEGESKFGTATNKCTLRKWTDWCFLESCRTNGRICLDGSLDFDPKNTTYRPASKKHQRKIRKVNQQRNLNILNNQVLTENNYQTKTFLRVGVPRL